MKYVVPTIQSLKDLTQESFAENSLVYPFDLKRVKKIEEVRLVLVGHTKRPTGNEDCN